MVEHPFGWLSVLPPVAAIVLAIATRRVLFSLLAGIFVGSLVLCQWNPIAALEQMLADHLWATLLDPNKLSVFVFTMLMGVMVGVVNRAAGMKGLVELVTPLARNRRRGQLVTWFLGLFVFFDDYANTMLLGNTLRPLSDKLKIAREKLAFLVDSTAAPVSGLALISTWVAGEIGYVSDGVSKLPAELEWKPFELFVASIPYRFYVLWALIFVPMIAILGRDYGPMRRAELRAIGGDPIGTAGGSGAKADPTAPDAATPARWFNAVIPVLVTVFATVWFLYASGAGGVSSEAAAELSPFGYLMEVFGNADSYGSLLWGALSGAVAAYVLIIPQRLVSNSELITAGGNGALKMLPALAILWFASALSNMTGNDSNGSDGGAVASATEISVALNANGATMPEVAAGLQAHGSSAKDATIALLALGQSDAEGVAPLTKDALEALLVGAGYAGDEVTAVISGVSTTTSNEVAYASDVPYANDGYRLYTGVFLSNLMGDSIPPGWMPTIVFILSSFVAFSTGTSWGTMGIVMPLVIPLVYFGLATGDATVSPNDPVLLGSIGAVLAGAIFGDHCSPISDTTVLSSQASGCDHVEHVRTQLPYALTIAVIAIVAGTIPIGFGFPVWLTTPIGVGLMLAAIMFFGKRTEPVADE